MENEERNALFETRLSRSSTGGNSRYANNNNPNGGGSGNGHFGNQPPQQQQHQHQQLSWEQVRRNIDANVAERQRGLRSAYESVEVGRETLERLEEQEGERLSWLRRRLVYVAVHHERRG